MKRHTETAISIIFIAVFISAVLFILSQVAQGADIAEPHRYVLRMSGSDEAVKSPYFTVSAHWKITCTAEKVGQDMDVRVFADVPTQSVEMIYLTSGGTRSAYMRDAGRFRISVLGFGASWIVIVEETK